MPIKPTYPGVYIEEIPSGVRTITGVSTSIGLFVGRTKQGPLKKPTLCLNFTDFVRTFSADTTSGDMPRQVRLFFENGGTQCYVMRIANGATPATVTLKSEAGADVLVLTAKNAGLVGETIRAAVTYSGPQPEATFNIELFRWETTPTGQLVKADLESWSNLTMDSASPRYAVDFLTQNSRLVDVAPAAVLPALTSGFSHSGRLVAYDNAAAASLRTGWAARLGTTATTNRFQISVDGIPFVEVDLQPINVGTLPVTSVTDFKNALRTAIASRINTALPLGKTVTVQIPDGPPPATGGAVDRTSRLRIESANGDVLIRPAAASDLAVPLMLGTDQGGLEVSRFMARRPAPTGITLNVPAHLDDFAGLQQDAFNVINFGPTAPVSLGASLQTVGATARMFTDNRVASPNSNSDGMREKLGIIANAVTNFAAATPGFNWKAEVWGSRLALIPTGGGDNELVVFSTGGTDIASRFTRNVRYYSLGTGGAGNFQTPAATLASDGSPPLLSDYADAYEIIDKEVDLFNLVILPEDAGPGATAMRSVWGPASVFCQRRRAFLLMDAPGEWTEVQKAIDPVTGVNSLRTGLVKDFSAIFYPRLIVSENGREVTLGPSGAIAGLMARIDGSRGVWKAPAGTEADLRGIVRLERKFSDGENGVLNPKGINTLRVFPTGIVNWGARTMDGDDDFGSEWKYIPIRRLALFIEESLYRGTKWVVFEPNDEPLWAQIRLNVGAFMHNLFRQGAFQGTSPREAYFVKCDSETTTQNDRNLGIVNILVGFAPLKPAEFVIIKIQQIAGQIQT